MSARHALAGIALGLSAVACFAALDTTSKRISLVVPVMMALWFRYLFQALSTTLLVLPGRGLSALRTAHPRFQLLRGTLLFICSTLAFFSLKVMPVGEFTAIVMVTPLVVTLVAAVWLPVTTSTACPPCALNSENSAYSSLAVSG